MYRFIGALLVATLAAANPAQAETIGFSQVGTESDWRTAFSADMQTEAKSRHIDLHFADAQNSIERQYADVRRFIAEKVDAIVIAPVVVTGWTQILKEAQSASIPVFIADRAVDADPALFVARIAADFNLEGRLAGAWLAQASRGRCPILELQGTVGSAPAIERKKGFGSVISLFPGMRIIRSDTGNFTQEGGYSLMAKLILATDRLKGICAIWATMTT